MIRLAVRVYFKYNYIIKTGTFPWTGSRTSQYKKLRIDMRKQFYRHVLSGDMAFLCQEKPRAKIHSFILQVCRKVRKGTRREMEISYWRKRKSFWTVIPESMTHLR